MFKQKRYHDNSNNKKTLTEYMQTADNKKIKAVYTLLENEIESNNYPNDFKTELDNRFNYYIQGGKMVDAKEAEQYIDEMLNAVKQ